MWLNLRRNYSTSSSRFGSIWVTESARCVCETILRSGIVDGFHPNIRFRADPKELAHTFSEIWTFGPAIQTEDSRLIVHEEKIPYIVESVFLHLMGEVGDNIAQLLNVDGKA